jgi:hypothetical protein
MIKLFNLTSSFKKVKKIKQKYIVKKHWFNAIKRLQTQRQRSSREDAIEN